MHSDFQCNYCHQEQFDIVSEGIRDWEYGVDGSFCYFRCKFCEGVQLHPFPDLENLKRAYDIEYHGYATGEKRGFLFSLLYAAKESLFRRQMSRLVTSGSRVLDVGCGAGEFLLNMKRLGLTSLQGIDFSEDMITSLEQQGISGYCGTFPDFSAPAQSYDLISMNNYLEHTVDPRAELEKSLVLLCPGGVGAAVLVHYAVSWDRIRWLLRR